MTLHDGGRLVKDMLIEAELKDALTAPGCALCRIGEQASARYLRFVLHESVNDLTVRNRLLAAWGFCGRHAWYLLRLEEATIGDLLGTAILGEGLIEAVQQVIAEDRPDPRSRGQSATRARRRSLERLRLALEPKAECPACFRKREHETYALSILINALDDSGWRERVASSAGLCLNHLRAALQAGEDSDVIQWLLAEQGRRLNVLFKDLQEYIRKHDYRFADEAPGPERTAPARAIAHLSGTWFGLPGPPGQAPSPRTPDTP